MFDPNDGFMYALVALVVAVVVAQSVFFLLKALRRARELGISSSAMKTTMVSSAVFTIAPAIAILIGVIALSKALGFPFPWLRLSVIGAITYETSAAITAGSAVGITDLSQLITDPKAFSTIAWVMTLGIIPGPFLVAFFGKKIEGGLDRIKNRDKRWSEHFMTSLFLGMISAFLGVVFAEVGSGLSGWIPVFVLLSSAVIMAICGTAYKKTGARWLSDYALPLSMLAGMALSIPITSLVNSVA